MDEMMICPGTLENLLAYNLYERSFAIFKTEIFISLSSTCGVALRNALQASTPTYLGGHRQTLSLELTRAHAQPSMFDDKRTKTSSVSRRLISIILLTDISSSH